MLEGMPGCSDGRGRTIRERGSLRKSLRKVRPEVGVLRNERDAVSLKLQDSKIVIRSSYLDLTEIPVRWRWSTQSLAVYFGYSRWRLGVWTAGSSPAGRISGPGPHNLTEG